MLAFEMSPVLGQGFETALERDLGGNWYAVAAFSGQSFQTLEALNFEPSDFVLKLTLYETLREVAFRLRFSTHASSIFIFECMH